MLNRTSRHLRRFINDNPLGLLITALDSSTFPRIQCTHIPWVLDVIDDGSELGIAKLRGHLAKQNPHAKALIDILQNSSKNNKQLGEEVSVTFTGSAQHYVTPKFYVETKPSTGKVVPTWNYSAVQVYGKATVFHDSKAQETSTFLQTQIHDLSNHAETSIMGYQKPWNVDDAPEKYIDLLRKNIIGIEIEITRLEGKHKMSQELKPADREGVIEGFRALQNETGSQTADMVKQRSS